VGGMLLGEVSTTPIRWMVAARAKCSKGTLSGWPSKSQLVVAALYYTPDQVEAIDTGTLAAMRAMAACGPQTAEKITHLFAFWVTPCSPTRTLPRCDTHRSVETLVCRTAAASSDRACVERGDFHRGLLPRTLPEAALRGRSLVRLFQGRVIDID